MMHGRLLDGRTARVITDAHGRIRSVENGGPNGPERLPILLPGLVDLQVNGYGGHDVNADDITVDTVHRLAEALWAAGTTTFFPTVITAGEDKIVHALETIAAAVRSDPLLAHSVAGIHVEGPYLSAADGARGAHDARHLRDPDTAELARWVAASDGLLRIVTLAPERAGATAYIEAAMRAGVLVSIGHCAAEPDQIHRAAAAGASLSTHLGNGIQPLLPRHPNQIWSQLADDRLSASFIADGHHLPADALTAMIRAKGISRSFLVSDSAALAGSPPGTYTTAVGGRVSVTDEGGLVLAGSTLLAGSAACLLDCVRWARTHTPLSDEDLLSLAAANPAQLAGLADRASLTADAAADLVFLDDDFRVLKTVVAGTVVHRADHTSQL
ncbi:N-acetylglucosamine-6-phosphate deacetylase [Streptomyces sp. NPDC056061]|uniref:N-acetylglucosamine-6-phosphate deacetylase n=1 Tax=Streptomyces sp. NPDC056061 TaxID=3345700 RepID=UPI0035E3A15D